MKIFISGPMTGITNYNVDAFVQAARELDGRGHSTMSPHMISAGDKFSHSEYMHVCKAMLDVCDAIYMLPGWENSDGARQEMMRAIERHKKIILGEVFGHGENKSIID